MSNFLTIYSDPTLTKLKLTLYILICAVTRKLGSDLKLRPPRSPLSVLEQSRGGEWEGVGGGGGGGDGGGGRRKVQG